MISVEAEKRAMKKSLILSALLTMILMCIGLLSTRSVNSQGWYDPNWAYRRAFNVANPGGTILTNYCVKVTLDNSFDFVHARNDGGDIRCTAGDGITQLSFWRETWNSGSSSATLWVKLPSVPIGGTSIYLYYGNSGAADSSDGLTTFTFFDDFAQTSQSVLQGNWPRIVVDSTLDGAHNVVMEDVDGDGKKDLVATAYRAACCVWYKQPPDPINGKWTKYVVDANLHNAHDFQLGDIDGDGLKDIVGLGLSDTWEDYNLGNGTLAWYKKPANPLGNGSGAGWTSKTSIPYSEADGSAALYNNQLYLFGGHHLGGADPQNQAYKYDPPTDSWTKLADMPTERWGQIAVELNGKIHVFAGNTGSAATGIHEIYDPSSDSWETPTPGNPLAIPSYGASGVVHPDVIYFQGQKNGYEYWMVYTPYPGNANENPSILRSHDGVTWTDAGVSNPVIPVGRAGAWNAVANMDPDFMYVADLNTWFMVWGGEDSTTAERLAFAYSSDGLNWTEYDGAAVNGNTDPVIMGSDDSFGAEWETGGSGVSKLQCPTMLYENGTFYLYYVEDGSGLNRGKVGSATFTWNRTTHSIQNLVRNSGNPVMDLPADSQFMAGCGHLNISRHPSDGLYYMHAPRQLQGTSSFALDLLTSADKTTWTNQGKVLDRGATGQWDETHIYRSCPVVDSSGTIVLSNGGFRLFYSAYSGSTPNIGIADFPAVGPPVKLEGDGPRDVPVEIANQGLMGVAFNNKIQLFYQQYHYEYDPVSDTYTSKADVPTPRTWATCALVNGKIYLIGGYSYGSPTGATNVNEAYDPSSDSWTTLTPMPVSKYGVTRENPVINGTIFVTHGMDGGFHSDNYAYTPASDSWQAMTSGINPRDGVACGVVNNKLYVMGGRGDYLNGGTGTNFIEEYSPAADTQLWVKTVIKSSGHPGLLGARSCGLGDVDLDGNLDIVVAIDGQTYGTLGGLYWYRNPGGANALNPSLWTEYQIDITQGCGADAQVVDVDEDGHPDIVYAGNTGSPDSTFIYFAPADPTNIPGWKRVGIAGNAYHLYPVDFDGDGHLDLIRASAGSSLVSWLKNPGGAAARNPANWREYVIEQNSTIPSPNRAMAVDIDGDGKLDIGMDATDGGRSMGIFKWYRRPADPTNVSGYQIYTIDNNPTYTIWAHDSYVGDLNGDGRPDMAGVGCNANTVLWWLNNPGAAPPSIDQMKWTFALGASTQAALSGGLVTLTATNGVPVLIHGTTGYGMDCAVEFRARHPQAGMINEIVEGGFIGDDFYHCARLLDDFPDVSHWERITTNGTGYVGNVVSMGTTSDTNWHTFHVYRRSPNKSIFQVDNNQSETDSSNTSTAANLYPFLMSYTTGSTNQILADWIRVRNYTSPEPVVSCGPGQFSITVGAQHGTVRRSPDQPLYDSNAVVQFTATAVTGYHFVSWSGDASGSLNPLNVTMDANKNIVANFAMNNITVTSGAAAGWNLISVPLQQSDMTPAGVFGDNYGVQPYYVYQYASSGRYLSPPELAMGEGYWLGSNIPAAVDAVGIPTGTFGRSLFAGFDLIGNPFPTNEPLDSLKFTDGVSTFSMAQASAHGWLSPILYKYTGTGYAFESDTMEVWRGYWIPMLVGGKTIEYAPLQAGTAPKAVPVIAEPMDSKHWDVELNALLELPQGEKYTDAIASFGVREDAKDSLDTRYDMPRPPRGPGSGFIEVNFPMNDVKTPELFGGNCARLYHSPENATWNFEVKASIAGKVTLKWNKSGISTLGANVKVILFDRAAGKSIDMKQLDSYTYKEGGTSRRFTVNNKAGEMPRGFELRQNYPNPFNPQTEITFGIPTAGPVRVEVFNVLGEKVVTLADEEKPAGYYTIRWDGRDRNSMRATSGVYLCRMTAGNVATVIKMLLLK